MSNCVVRVQETQFDVSECIDILTKDHTDIGAVASFIGLVRASTSGNLTPRSLAEITALELHHYPGMTENALVKIAQQAQQQFSLNGVIVVHRVGHLTIGEPIVLVACSATQRAAALDGCECIIHRLKVNAPFWKKEFFADGSAHWVEQSTADKNLGNL